MTTEDSQSPHGTSRTLLGLAGALFACIAPLCMVGALLAGRPGSLGPAMSNLLNPIAIGNSVALLGAAFAFGVWLLVQAVRSSGASGSLRVGPTSHPVRMVLLALVWILGATAAGLLAPTAAGPLLAPVFYLSATLAPISIAVSAATHHLDSGSPLRRAGLITGGMLLATFIAVVFELMMIAIAALGVLLHLGSDPQAMAQTQMAYRQLISGSSERMLTGAAVLAKQSWVWIAALATFAVGAPLIEEVSKSVPVLMIRDRFTSAEEGFAAGARSGAGFAAVESLISALVPGTGWGFLIWIRGLASAMHIATAALTGWGVASWTTHKNIRPLLGSYLAALVLHGLWNGSLVMVVLGGLRLATRLQPFDVSGAITVLIGLLLLLCAIFAAPLVLAMGNGILRKRSTSDVPVAVASGGEAPRSDMELRQ